MTDMPNRVFSVRARYGGGRAPQAIAEVSFEAAALAFVEDWPHPAADEEAVSVLVQEVESGREHCYRIHLDTGLAEPCG